MQLLRYRLASIALTVMVTAETARAGSVYVQTNLVSNGTVPNTKTDANLVGAWGLSFSSTSAFWISDQAGSFNGGGSSTVYSVTNTNIPSSSGNLLTVGVPNLNNAPPSQDQTNGPTGQVNTSAPGITTASTDFQVAGGKASFIFANLDGSISAWRGGLTPSNEAQITASVAGASFTGLAIGNLTSGAALLYAADQNSGNIDVFNSKWQMTGSFTDPNFSKFPSGYAAFNVQNLSVNGTQTLFVTFANQSTTGGIVDEFTTSGTYIKTIVDDTAGTHLAAPWGVAIAPTGWGQFGGDLLVANNNPNSDGLTEINAYNLTTGAWAGTLTLGNGQIFSEDELWAISFGNGHGGGSAVTLFFTAGLDNNTNGLFGAISVSSVPEPSSAVLGLIAIFAAAAFHKWRCRRLSVMA